MRALYSLVDRISWLSGNISQLSIASVRTWRGCGKAFRKVEEGRGKLGSEIWQVPIQL
jgi:hypothetical protein